MTTSRKDFFKKVCLTGACICGFPSLVEPVVAKGNNDENEGPQMEQKWLADLLNNIAGIEDEEISRKLIKPCAINHYSQLHMDEFLAPYEGRLDAFKQFIEKEWGWKIDYQKEKGFLLADENKNYCVCPVIKPDKGGKTPALCYCSEGFAELMFSKVAGQKVDAKVISSIHRGDSHCVYMITFS